MRTPDAILKELGSDNIDLTPELLADAAGDESVVATLVTLVDRVAEKPRSATSYESNLVSWAPYVFAEVGCSTLIRPLAALYSQKGRFTDHLLGGYASYDAPSIFLRLAGQDVAKAFASVLRSREAAPELRVAPIMAAGAAWAHGLISRDEALAPLRAELNRLAKPESPEEEEQEWLDIVLDAALDLHPEELKTELAAVAENWGLDEDWDAELTEALADTQRNALLRFRENYPRFDKAIEFVERWEELDAELDDTDKEPTGKHGDN